MLFLTTVVNIPTQTLIVPPRLLVRKVIISQLELGPPVVDLVENTHGLKTTRSTLSKTRAGRIYTLQRTWVLRAISLVIGRN